MNEPRPTPVVGQPPLHGQHPAPYTGQPHRPAPAAPAPHLPGARPGIAPMPVQPIKANESDLDPIELVSDEVGMPINDTTGTRSKIKAFGVEAKNRDHAWKRSPFKDGQGAVRVKTFHGKYSDQGMEHLDDVINEWLDNHPEVEIKFVTSTVNVFEGKIREPALVLNVWY